MTSLLEQHIAALRAARAHSSPAAAEAAGPSGPRHDPNAPHDASVAQLLPPPPGLSNAADADEDVQLPRPNLDGQYDALVRATVRRAWERAWADYQSGRWLYAAPPMLLAGATATNPCEHTVVAAPTTNAPNAAAARARCATTSVLSASAVHTHAKQPQATLYEFNDVHPHQPASNKPSVHSYTMRERQRVKARQEVLRAPAGSSRSTGWRAATTR